jgi:RNA polymerase sigma factor (sigma-70 family)
MAGKWLNDMLRRSRKLATLQTSRGLSDRELLERFLDANDESAFTVLIERHGPMVLGVCRRALGNHHDAEDACQATFLVLARQVASVRKKTSLSSWLHGVAWRTASNLRREQKRRRRREQDVEPTAPRDAGDDVSRQEVQVILDEELEHLPERYRSPLVLCYLDGKTRDEAAQQLGLRAGTLHGRLERGRELLRKRLTARGLTLSAALFATALRNNVAHAALSPTLVLSSAKAALLLAAGKPLPAGIISGTALTLTQEVLRNMFLAKLKIGTATVLCAGLIAALIGGALASTGLAQNPPSSQPSLTAAAKAASDEEFIRRTSLDLRSTEPTPAEVHFFVANKDSGKRQKLIDLFIQERQARQEAKKKKEEGQPIELTRNFDKGKFFSQTMTTEAKQTMKVMGSEVVQNQEQTFYFSWTPEKQDGDNWTVKQKIEGVKVTIDIGGNKVEYDSTKAQSGTNPLADFFKALVGAEFTLTIDKNMKVTKIEGREKFLEGLGKANPQMKPLLEQILSEEALKEMADKALVDAELTLTLDKNLKVLKVIKIKFVLPQEGQPPKK